jgi:hypothetical protein
MRKKYLYLSIFGIVIALMIGVVVDWNFEPDPGQYDASRRSASLRSDIRAMWKTRLLQAIVENAGTPTPHASTDAAINAASRVFNTVKFIGMTREEVIATIGDPKASNDSIYNFPFFHAPKESLVYRFDSGAYGWQFNLLFDAEGKVNGVERHWIY